MLQKTWKWRGKGPNEAGIGMLADYWFWIFRGPVTGERRSTGLRWTAVGSEVSAVPGPGTVQLRDSETDFEDTVPLVFHNELGQ